MRKENRVAENAAVHAFASIIKINPIAKNVMDLLAANPVGVPQFPPTESMVATVSCVSFTYSQKNRLFATTRQKSAP